MKEERTSTMFSHHVSAVMFCRLWCSLSKGLGISLALLFFFAFGLSQAEGYGFQSAEWSPYPTDASAAYPTEQPSLSTNYRGWGIAARS
jgi:hypothetical protein